jgi:hypothetical protein
MEFANYRVVHWFFNKQALEFLNIGVVIFSDNNDFLFKLIDDKLLRKIEANFINKEILSYTISYIDSFLKRCKSGKDLDAMLKIEYQDNFRFSETKTFRPFDRLEDELDQLFYHYIGYKWSKKDKK